MRLIDRRQLPVGHTVDDVATVCPKPRGGQHQEGVCIDVDMSDSIVQGTIIGETIEQLTSTGKHLPTAYLSGRCQASDVSGCRYWLMLANNSRESDGTPDVVGFLVFDGAGVRVAYGTGPVVETSRWLPHQTRWLVPAALSAYWGLLPPLCEILLRVVLSMGKG